MVREAFPSVEMVRMVSSGTEAVMSAIRLARAATGRDDIVKFEGCYHGHSDQMLVKAGSGALTLGMPDSPGVPADLAKHTLNLPYNDLDAVRRLLRARKGKIAAVIVEPVAANAGVILPKEGFLQGLRQVTAEHGALLIFDEVITGFRLALGGAQEYYGVRPDLTCLGKIIGGGLPVGAYGGRRDLMAQIAPSGPVYQAGTLSGNPLAMAAGIATLSHPAQEGRLREPRAQGRLSRGRHRRQPGEDRRQGRPEPGRFALVPLLHGQARRRLLLGQDRRREKVRPLLHGHAQGRRLPRALPVRSLVHLAGAQRRRSRPDPRRPAPGAEKSVITAMRGPEEQPVAWAKYLSNASIGIEMGAALVVGMGIGWFLDRTFETKPWFLVIFTGFGIVAGFRNMIVAARKAAAEEDRQ